MFAANTRFDDYLWLALRVAAGGILVPHGAQKLFGVLGSPGIDVLSTVFEDVAGLSPGMPFVYFTGAVEFFGGLLLLLGLATRLSALGAVGVLVGAMVLVNMRSGFFWTSGGIEYPLMWTVLCLCFVVRGGGAFSIDARLSRR